MIAEKRMKQVKPIFILLFLAILFACEQSSVTFKEPQPADTDNLDKFSRRLFGEYISTADQSSLLISEQHILRIYDYEYKQHKNQLDSNAKLSGDSLTDLTTNEIWLIKRDGDSVIRQIHHVDTLFVVNQDHVLRKFKGYYFLNTCTGPERWEVQQMELSRGKLIISQISTQDDIDKLMAITETAQDTVPATAFKPSKKQFRKFIRSKGFSNSETFVRLRKNKH
jgi:hypothetical protein